MDGSVSLKKFFQNMFKNSQLETIEFVAPIKKDTYVDELKSKYQSREVLSNKNSLITQRSTHQYYEEMNATNNKTNDHMKPPMLLISDPNLIIQDWLKHRITRLGFINVGNTCFLNSILQIFAYTAPFWNYTIQGIHKKECNYQGFCASCEFTNLFNRMNENNSSITPRSFVTNIRSIKKNFRIGQQQDAHEFFLALIENMQTTLLKGHEKLDRYSKATTSIDHIFGGWTQTIVQCQQCAHSSTTYSPLIDISVKINKVNDIESALNVFTRQQYLNEPYNRYNCEKCMKKVAASIKTCIYKPPTILTIQLSRFSFQNGSINKSCKPIKFKEILDLKPFLSKDIIDVQPIKYGLYGMVVHRGSSCSCGHYYSYVKDSNDIWYMANDSQIHKVSWDKVANDQPYMLFYKKITPKSLSTNNSQNDACSNNSGILETTFMGKNIWEETCNTINKSTIESVCVDKPNNDDLVPYQESSEIKKMKPTVIKWDQKVTFDKTIHYNDDTNNTIEKLENELSTPIHQWDGKISTRNISFQTDEDILNSKVEKRYTNTDDEEYDCGKVKKVKISKFHHDNRLFRSNAFQSFYNRIFIQKQNKIRKLKTI